ncbi:MAG: NAD-dependent epimerase/dehydratase family protein [Verrucomicrobiae bacterium]|nr:NAD-dependent epimerase/dehydratase family protein [Verrucomicrobiae bacterium]
MSESSFYRGKKVLVTGGTGFVGGHLVDALLEAGADVRVAVHNRPLRRRDSRIEVVSADLRRPEECRDAVRGVQYVFHAAGSVGAAGVGAARMMNGIVTNLVLTAQVLEAAWAEGVERFLLFSSSTVYPAVQHAVVEEEAWNGPPHPSYFGYGWMRRYCERLGEFVAANSGLKIALVRPSAVYGPGDNFDLATCHVIPALVRRAVERQDPFVVWGTGDEVRDFLHVRDLVRGCLLALEKHAECDPVNLGCGRGATVKEVVKIILRAAGHQNAQVVFDSSKPATIPFRMVDISKARRLLGFEPRIGLEEGLSETVRWYRSTL